MSEQIMLFVASVFKGTTLNKKRRLDHESLRHPETRILRYHGYIYTSGGAISIIVCYLLGIPFSQFIDVNWSLVNGGVTKVVTRGKERKLALSTLNEHDIFEQHADKELITYI